MNLGDDNKRIKITPLPEPKKKAPPKPKMGKAVKVKEATDKKIIAAVEEAQASQQDVAQLQPVKKTRGRPKMDLKDRKLGPLQKLGVKVPKTQSQLDVLAMARMKLRQKRAERKKLAQEQFVSPQSESAEAAQQRVFKNATQHDNTELAELNISANPQRNVLTDPGDTPEPWNTKQSLATQLKKEELNESRLKLSNANNFTTMYSNAYTLDGTRSSQGEHGRTLNKGLKQPGKPFLQFL